MLDWILEVSRVDQLAASHAFVGYESIAREILPLEVQVKLMLDEGMDVVEEGIEQSQFALIIIFDTKHGFITVNYNSDADKNEDLAFVIGHLVTAIKDVVRDP